VATDAVLAEIAGEFDNEDPLKHQTREALDESMQRLLPMRDELKEQGEEIDLVPPSEAAQTRSGPSSARLTPSSQTDTIRSPSYLAPTCTQTTIAT
jgi:hypothetical protein